MSTQPAGPFQLPLRDPMWTKQGQGDGLVDLGVMTRQWIGRLQALAALATNVSSLGLLVKAVVLAPGANSLDPTSLSLPATPTGLLVVILSQPGEATITWSSDFSAVVDGIDETADTLSVFLFVAAGTKWVMISYTTGMTP